MATKVKPTRLNITGTPNVGQVPTYVDADTFAWGAGGGGGASFGRFLSLWDCTTGQPISFPEATPYNYMTGDYFIVSVVSSATPPVNYRPDGSSYNGTASSVTELDDVKIGDTYVYDGSVWLLQFNNGTTYTASTGISINSSNQISNTGVLSVNGSTGAVTYTAPVASVNTQTGAVVLDADDISDTGTTNLWTNATEKSTWSGKQDALTLPGTPTSGHIVTWGADNKTLADGGAVPTGVPAVGTNGQVLTVVSGAAAWANAPATGIQNDTTGTTTTVTAIRAGTEQEYNSLGTYDASTIYHIY